MRVTEQIDAMRALGTDPSKKLVTPRVIATIVMLFFLTILSDLFGLVGGWFVSRLMLGLDSYQYWTSTYQNLTFGEVVRGLVKPVVFGFVIGTVGCFYGLTTKGGTRGVGLSTTQAVVASSILVLVLDFFITRFLLVFWPT
jgi:phospholipid/cholesterol/gamma-HCH transport system permease protein